MVTRWLVAIAVATACDAGVKPEDLHPPASNAPPARARPSQPPPVPMTIEWRDPCSLSLSLSDRYNIVYVDDHCNSAMISGSFVREDPNMGWLEDQLKYVKEWHGGGCTTVEIVTDNVPQADLGRLHSIAMKRGFVDARFTARRDLALTFPESVAPKSCEPRPPLGQTRETR